MGHITFLKTEIPLKKKKKILIFENETIER